MLCETCGKEHPAEAIELAFHRPDEVFDMPADERQQRVQEDNDLAAIDRQRFFVRTVLPLPVRGRDIPYNIGVWVEVQEKAFARVIQLWEDPSQESEPAFEARLANEIPFLPSTRGLTGRMYLTGPKTRPKVLVENCDHPLYLEQSHGISVHRAFQYTDRQRGV